MIESNIPISLGPWVPLSMSCQESSGISAVLNVGHG